MSDATPPKPPALSDQAARTRVSDEHDATLFVEAGAGSGKTRSLVERVVALVEHGVDMRHIAAITFTEKAAAELRDRIRRAIEGRAQAADVDAATRQRLHRARGQVDAAAISTLHAFAQRILSEHPIEAGLPPNVDVLDEVASQVEFDDRWRRFRDELLDTPELERPLLLAFAAGVRLQDLRALATVFDGGWDRLTEHGRLPWGEVAPPAVDVSELVADMDALVARCEECRDGGDRLCRYLREEVAPYAQRLRAAPDEYEALRLLVADKPTLRAGKLGRKDNWVDNERIREGVAAVREARDDLVRRVGEACLQRIAVEVSRFTLAAAEQRRTSGRLEFHDLLVLARDLLRDPRHGAEARARLGQRYQRLLLDEFQDTDPIQIELATLIASGDPHAGDKPWADIPVEPGRLFFVGDPKQSIYRFRRADIALFLTARAAFGERVSLTTNFRCAPAIIEWVNHVFGQLIVYEEGSQPEYEPLQPAPQRCDPPEGMAVSVVGSQPHTDDPDAETLRAREAADVAHAVRTALGWQVSEPGPDGRQRWRPATLADITILLPARTSLPELQRALDRAGVAYRAETSSLVYATREIRELMSAARAVVDPTDQLALLTALRSPLFGCGDDDLFTYRVVHGGRWHVCAERPEGLDDDHPVVAALRYLGGLHHDVAWLAPSQLLDRLARDRRLFELGYAQGRPRDLWRRLRFVIDQARAWSESEGGSCRQYLEWARLQASDSTRVAETVLPETDDDSVRILTIHGSKGLEFPITLLSGMTTASRAVRSRVEVTFPDAGAVGVKMGAGLTTAEFDAFQPVDEQMGYHERLRLLYVAATRAQDHLVVSLHRKQRKGAPDQARKRTNAELLANACHDWELTDLSGQPARVVDTAAAETAEPLPPLEEWETERDAALAASGRRRSLGASDVALLPAPGGADGEETRAGAAKQPRDLELPAWQKGRYGTAIGRAVHAVLQTIDLATGEPLSETVAAQAAAEGVIGREGDITRLVRAALNAAVVRESLQWPRWRETYVATRVGEHTLEGYIDLLHRTDDGLVVVDYKTASAGADLDERLHAYRAQGAAYAAAIEGATAEPVARVVFVFLTPDGAVELDLPDPVRASRELQQQLRAGGLAAEPGTAQPVGRTNPR